MYNKETWGYFTH